MRAAKNLAVLVLWGLAGVSCASTGSEHVPQYDAFMSNMKKAKTEQDKYNAFLDTFLSDGVINTEEIKKLVDISQPLYQRYESLYNEALSLPQGPVPGYVEGAKEKMIAMLKGNLEDRKKINDTLTKVLAVNGKIIRDKK
jgi:hypothetical protein